MPEPRTTPLFGGSRRARGDEAGFELTLDVEFDVIANERRGILVVQDSDPTAPGIEFIPPDIFTTVEAAHIEEWFSGRVYEFHKTNGVTPPTPLQLANASTLIWIHGSNVAGGGRSVLLSSFQGTEPSFPSTLASWREAGGNLLLCGLQPSNAMRFVTPTDCRAVFVQHPLDFTQTISDTSLIRHLALDAFGLAAVNETYANTDAMDLSARLREATPQLPGYPRLVFDPLRWPSGPRARGFGYYDAGLVPFNATPEGGAVVLYSRNGGSDAIGVARLNGRGRTASSVYLGFHPYFLDSNAVVEFLDRVLSDFGERRVMEHVGRD